MGFFLKKILTALILPPMSLLWIAFFALIIIKKLPKFGRALGFSAIVLVFLLSTPYFSSNLKYSLQSKEVVNNFKTDIQAIVILGGGVYYNAPEYKGHNLSSSALERIKYGAYLFDKTGIPILVSGGDPLNTGVTEASVMKSVLESEFLTPVTWVEGKSKDTFENAKFSYQILSKLGKKRIYLVTNAWHMPRAKKIFKQFGFQVTPAPTVMYKKFKLSVKNLIPSASFFHDSALVCREILGRIWYWFLIQKDF